MIPPDGDHPDDAYRLLEQARTLQDRLRRVVVALTITDDLLTDACTRLAEQRPQRADEFTLAAIWARTHAAECRAFAARLDQMSADRFIATRRNDRVPPEVMPDPRPSPDVPADLPGSLGRDPDR
jgi:hypothetical protein